LVNNFADYVSQRALKSWRHGQLYFTARRKKIKEKIQNNMKTVDEASNMPADCYGKD